MIDDYAQEMNGKGTCYKVAAGLGALSGIRCMSSLALLAHQAESRGNAHLKGTIFVRPKASQLVRMLSLGELFVEKFPLAPSRTSWPALFARGACGAFVGATVCGAYDGDRTKGAILGATGALVSAFVSEGIGGVLTKNLHIPRFFVTLTEDTCALLGGLVLLEILKQDSLG